MEDTKNEDRKEVEDSLMDRLMRLCGVLTMVRDYVMWYYVDGIVEL